MAENKDTEVEKEGKKMKNKRYFSADVLEDPANVEVYTIDTNRTSKYKSGASIRHRLKNWKKTKVKSSQNDSAPKPSQDNENETKAKESNKNKGDNPDQEFGADKIVISDIKEDLEEERMRKKKHEEKRFRREDPFPGDKPVPKELIQKYERGEKMNTKAARTKFAVTGFRQKEKKLKLAAKQAARAELLLQEEAGFIEADEGESTRSIRQSDIVNAVDITSAQKHFDLNLKQFGPYNVNYTRNGRFLLLGGRKGHVAAIDWLTKKLLCEINVMETVNDIKWLHQETMFAVAQKQWTYIYDNQGIELHCLKKLDSVLKLEFLPFHFLLASANTKGYLSWIDVSIGQKVAGHSTGLGRLDVMCQNPNNAIINLGHPGGTVSMWSPNVKEPLVKMLCHGGGVRSIAINKTGSFMATSGVDRKLKIWDLRTYKMLHAYNVGAGAGSMAFSQRGLLALGKGNIVEIYKDPTRETVTSPYLIHRLKTSVQGLQFCPFEDVLGSGHGEGFTSLIIPGAGEPNFDALEANPFQSKSQRKQAEVQMLLDKIPMEMIHLDTGKIGQVDQKTFQEKIEENNKVQFLKPKAFEFEPRYKMKGRSKGLKREQRKKGVQEEHQKELIRDQMKEKQKQMRTELHDKNRSDETGSVFDRFKKKKT